MASYKAEVTLNEKDTLFDMLSCERELVRQYAYVLSESVSRGFRTLVRQNFLDTVNDQLDVFLLNTNQDFMRVESADNEKVEQVKQNFKKKLKTLS